MRKHNASTEDYQEFLRAKTDFKKNNADYQGFIDGRDQGTTTYAEYQEYYRRKLNPQVLDLTGDDKPTIQNTSTPPQRRALPAPPSNHSKTSTDTSRSSSMMRTAQPSGNSTPRASNGHSGTWDDPMVLVSSDDDAPKQRTNPQISRQHGESGSGTPKKPPTTTTSSKDTPKRPSYISPYDQNPKRTFSSSKDAEEPKSSQGSYTPRSSSFKQPPNPFQSPPPPDSKTAANERVVDKDPPSSLSSHFGARLQLSTPSQSGRQVVGPEPSKTEGIKPSLSKDGTGQTGSKSIPPRDYLANPPHVKEGPASKIATAPNAKPSSPNKACGEQNAIESTTRRASATKPLLDKVYDMENKGITTPLFNGKDKEPDKLPDSSSKAQRLSIKPPKPLSHNSDNTSDRSQVKQTQDADERAQSKVQQSDRMELETAKFPASNDTPQASGGTDKQVVQLSTLLTKGAKETLADANLGTQQQMEPPRLKMETVAKNAFPLEVKQIETLLRKYVQECLEDQEEYVKFRFRKARLDQDETARRPKATQEKSERSLFADMPALEDHTHQTVGRKRFSIVWPTTSKTSDLSVPVMAYEPSTLMPPKYSNFVSLQSNVLSRNDTKLKYFPYFNDDFDGEKGDLYKELEERFKDQIKDRPLGRTRLEQAEMYGPYIEDFVKEVGTSLDDILFYLLDAANEPPSIEMSFAAMKSWMNRDVHCEGLFDRDAKKWTLVYSKIYQSKPDNYHLALAGLVCAAFMRVCGFSIWGLASRSPSANDISEKDQERLAGQSSGPSILDLRCTVCHVHNCPNHGAFVEHRSSGAEDDSSSEADTDSNEDAGHNHRQRAIHGQSKTPFSQRPAYQVGLPLAQYRGMDDNGTVTGDYTNPPIKFQSDEEEELCSSGCFWKKSNRKPMEANSEWSEKDVGNLKFALSAFINHPRGPCMIRHIVNTKPCWEIFNQMLALAPQHEENQKTPTRPKSRFQRKNPPKRKGSYWRKNSSTHNHELRKPFRPCNHDGSCEDANCRCFRENVTCEPSCTCPGSCERRFQGCGCERKGLMCWQNQDKCDCFQLNRECDPMLCKSCGVYEVLDPVNRHDDAILDGRCRNAAIQRGVPKRTLMGRSEVQGWGLFAGQDIEKDEFIGEYRGEVISRDESDRRGAVYHYRGLEYLFGVSESKFFVLSILPHLR
jgi:CXC domain/SET domain